MHDANSHWSMRDVDQDAPVSTGEAISSLDRHVVPVGPVHPVFKDRQREHVRHGAVVDHVTIAAVEVREPVTPRTQAQTVQQADIPPHKYTQRLHTTTAQLTAAGL